MTSCGRAECTRNAYQGLQLIGGSSSGAMVIETNPLESIAHSARAPAGKSVSIAIPEAAQRAFSGPLKSALEIFVCDVVGAHPLNPNAKAPDRRANLIRLSLL